LEYDKNSCSDSSLAKIRNGLLDKVTASSIVEMSGKNTGMIKNDNKAELYILLSKVDPNSQNP
jgi:hypothetical protein